MDQYLCDQATTAAGLASVFPFLAVCSVTRRSVEKGYATLDEKQQKRTSRAATKLARAYSTTSYKRWVEVLVFDAACEPGWNPATFWSKLSDDLKQMCLIEAAHPSTWLIDDNFLRLALHGSTRGNMLPDTAYKTLGQILECHMHAYTAIRGQLVEHAGWRK